jgi:16S rRNA (uracil1498-N3)-methyltransferase
VTLPDDEAEHLTRVLRLEAGDAVRIFNGHGAEFDAVVDRASRTGVSVRVGAPRSAATEARVAITLVQAVLKGDKMDDVVRDAVMMGVAAIQPVVTARTEVTIASLDKGRRPERWERVAIASAKQCGRAVVPSIAGTMPFDAIPAAVATVALPSPALMLVEPGASPDAVTLADLDRTPPRGATVLVGPEGGWTAAEIEAASGPCRAVTLGGRTLRADAMAVIALAALYARWNEY